MAEGILNSSERPPITSDDGKRILAEGKPFIHFNEADECAGLDALLDNRTLAALNQPLETTLHDVRWGDIDQSQTVDGFVWIFQISGAAPPAHFRGGWAGAQSWRQAPMYFPSGGGPLGGVYKPGEIVWSRTFVENGKLGMDIGRGTVVDLPQEEVDRRLNLCTPIWPIVNAQLHGVTRDQFMGRHRANHIQVCYPKNGKDADRVMAVKASMAHALGFNVTFCGDF